MGDRPIDDLPETQKIRTKAIIELINEDIYRSEKDSQDDIWRCQEYKNVQDKQEKDLKYEAQRENLREMSNGAFGFFGDLTDQVLVCS